MSDPQDRGPRTGSEGHGTSAAKPLPRGWYVTDYERDHEVLRGPYPNAEIAGAVRAEMERKPDEERNLWIVSSKSLNDLREAG